MISPAPAVAFAREAVGAAYVYGGTGQPCTPDYRRARAAQYPGAAENIRKFCQVLNGKKSSCAGCPWQGRAAFDCAQLVRRALMAVGLSLPSGASSQWLSKSWAFQSDAVFLAVSSVCVVFRRDKWNNARPMAHVGFALGDGFVVDARGHRDGVLLSRLSSYPWTHVAFPLGFPMPGQSPPSLAAGVTAPSPAVGHGPDGAAPSPAVGHGAVGAAPSPAVGPGVGVTAPSPAVGSGAGVTAPPPGPDGAAPPPDAGPGPDISGGGLSIPGAAGAAPARPPSPGAAGTAPAWPPSLGIGSRGEAVRQLQLKLLALGFKLPRYGADGVFGRETSAALRAWQHVVGIPATGLAYSDSLRLLLGGCSGG